jgi:hypothetical protein
MSKKTIIIAWKFAPLGNGNCQETFSCDNYEIIKFYTPENRNLLITEDGFRQLREIVSKENASDLFVFIHKPQFDGTYNDNGNMKDELLAFSNPTKNISVEPFEGGTHLVYELFIDQVTNTLKSDLGNSIESIFKGLEARYGFTTLLHTKIDILHQCLNPNELDQIQITVSEALKDDFTTFKKKVQKNSLTSAFDAQYISALTELRDK